MKSVHAEAIIVDDVEEFNKLGTSLVAEQEYNEAIRCFTEAIVSRLTIITYTRPLIDASLFTLSSRG